MKRIAFLLLTTLLTLADANAGRAAGPYSADAKLLGAINSLRAGAGLQQLSPDARLTCAAGRHAADNARRGTLDHTGTDGADLATRLARVGYPYRMAAENLALAGRDPAEILTLLQTIPGHRRNLLRPQARAAGIGRAIHEKQEVWVLIIAAENGEFPGKQGLSTQFACVSG